VVVVPRLDQLSMLEHASGPGAGERVRVSVGQALRETTRYDAIVGHSGTDFLIADSFASADATPLIDRMRGGVRSAVRMTLSVGVACTPMRALAAGPPLDIVDELVGLATTAMQQAVLAGGNTTKYVLCERLAALDERPAFGIEDI